MKKYLSFVLAASMSLSALTSTAVMAENTDSSAPSVNNIVVLGDSIASGYGLNEDEYSYAQLCTEYFGCNLNNFAVPGLSSDELLYSLKNNDSKQQSIANADVVVVSIGGNDIIHYASKQLLTFAAKKGLLADGYTEEDIPDDPGVYAMTHMIDKDAFTEYANSGIQATLELNTEIKALSMNLRLTEGNNAYGENQGIIKNQIMTNISESVNIIKDINPDAQIIVQTVYQPLQLSAEFVEDNYSDYITMFTTLRSDFNSIMETFRQELQNIDNIEILDVFQTITALENISDSTNATPGYAYYFTNIQAPITSENEDEETIDFHPNQKGHVAIAASLINTIKVKDTETGEFVTPAPAVRDVDPETGEATPSLLATTFNNIKDLTDYPLLAMEEITNALPEKVMPGDINNDGFVDSDDASIILGEYALLSTGNEGEFTDEEKIKADINYDNNINAVDATNALSYYAYLSTLSEEEEPVSIYRNMYRVYVEESNK